MDGRRFDAIVRIVAGRPSRRGFVSAVVRAIAANGLFGARGVGAAAWPRPCAALPDGIPCGACGVCRGSRCEVSTGACPAEACLRCDVATKSCVSRCRPDQYCAGGHCVDTLPCPGSGCAPGEPCSCPVGMVCCDGAVCCPEDVCCNGVCGGKLPADPCCPPGQQACGAFCCPPGQTCCEAMGRCLAPGELCCRECTAEVDGACVPTDRFDYCGPNGEDRCCRGECLSYNDAYRACYPCEAGTRRCPDSSYGDLGECCPVEAVCCNGFCCGNPSFVCLQVGSGGNVPHGDYTCDFPE